MHHPLKFEANFHGQSIGLLVVVGGRGLEPETVYYGDDALSIKPVRVMLIWALLIPATRGHAIQSKVLAMITDCSATL